MRIESVLSNAVLEFSFHSAWKWYSALQYAFIDHPVYLCIHLTSKIHTLDQVNSIGNNSRSEIGPHLHVIRGAFNNVAASLAASLYSSSSIERISRKARLAKMASVAKVFFKISLSSAAYKQHSPIYPTYLCIESRNLTRKYVSILSNYNSLLSCRYYR